MDFDQITRTQFAPPTRLHSAIDVHDPRLNQMFGRTAGLHDIRKFQKPVQFDRFFGWIWGRTARREFIAW